MRRGYEKNKGLVHALTQHLAFGFVTQKQHYIIKKAIEDDDMVVTYDSYPTYKKGVFVKWRIEVEKTIGEAELAEISPA